MSEEETPKQPAKRRLLPVVDRQFQWKYTLLVIAIGVGVSSAMGVLLYQAHRANTELLLVDDSLKSEVARVDQIFLLYLVSGILLLALLLGIWGLVITHRISGPLFLVTRYLSVLGSGQYPDVRPLRRRDELKVFFNSFEESLTQLRERDQNHLNDLNEALSNEDNPAQALEGVKKVRDALERRLGNTQSVEE